MKTNLVLVLFLLATASFAQPTIFRVNADVTVTGVNVHHTIQAAHDAATAGDILIVEPGASVGNLNCLKTLTIYGRGYFLDKNPNFANLPDKSLSSAIGTLDIYANNCKLSGLYITGATVIHGGASGTLISRNWITTTYLNSAAAAPINNTTFTQNYFSNSDITLNPVPTGYITNLTISNNQIYRVVFNSTYSTVATNYFSNILVNQNTMNYLYPYFASAVFSNNIFFVPDQGSLNINANQTNTTFNNNVTFGSTTIDPGFGANNSVISNAIGQFNSNTGGSSDNDYRVANGSLMKTANNLGGEVGMFGGDTPYIQYGIPAAPSVVKFFNTGIGNTDTPVTATVSGKSNN